MWPQSFRLYPLHECQGGMEMGCRASRTHFSPQQAHFLLLRLTSVFCESGAEATPPLANTVLLVWVIAKELRM